MTVEGQPQVFMGYLVLPVDAPNAELMPLLAALGPPPLNAWLEDELRPDGLRLRDDIAIEAAPELLRRWMRGRLFAERGELCWERRDDSMDLMLVAEGESPTGTLGVLWLEPTGGEELLLLWGERRADGWYEQRIPTLAGIYPESWPGPYAAIRAQTYEAQRTASGDQPSGVRIVTRYRGYVGDCQPQPDPRFSRADEEDEL